MREFLHFCVTDDTYSFWYLILQFMLRNKRILQNINKLPFFRLEMTGNFDLLSCVWCFDFLITPLKSCSPKSECGHVEPNAKFTWQIFLQSFGHLVVLHIKGKTCWFVRWITMSFTSSIMIARWKKIFLTFILSRRKASRKKLVSFSSTLDWFLRGLRDSFGAH